jgi:hypothetical protein
MMESRPVYGKEQDLVNDIVDLVNLSGGMALRINSGIILTDDRMEGVNSRRRVFRGAPAGTSDIIALWNGKFVAIECKLKGNKMTGLQTEFRDKVLAGGGAHILAYSLDDVIEGLGIGTG